ncbi:Copine-8 [Frankliniella fusca]|uniref:Copine-3 n=1 Tax=Frankliniella fusca TaxID=407009 RepID=A0AAE1I4L9_9NEOP|nr:Copine-8 [Frankliniella fusca]
MAEFVPGSASLPSSEVELTISCRNLLDCDVFSKSDPLCVVKMKTAEFPQWREVFRTEKITNSLNPDFVKKMQIQYRFEEQQILRFDVYDIDTKNPNLEEQDFLGYCVTTLGQVVSSGKVTMPLSGMPLNKGALIVSAEELAVCMDEITLKFVGKSLDRKDWLGKSDPFLEFAKVAETGDYSIVHRTEVIKFTLNPEWKPFTVSARTLCGGDSDRSIRVTCYDWNRSGNHSHFYTTLRQLSEGPGAENVYRVVNPNKQQKKSGTYTHSGEIILTHFEKRKLYSFLDYIMSASNGDPNSPTSLHYTGSSELNQYEQALTAVGEIIQDYDSDKLFPVLGFGARIPPHGQVSHEFFVNMHPSYPYCEGISGVIEAYKKCIRQIQLFGPTNFAPVINHVGKFAEAYQDGSQYFILLIITDGVITDMPQTKQAIIRTSNLPLSIIIVGVGNADFTAMNELDADTVPLIMDGVRAARDIVQFVPFNNFQRLADKALAKSYLAREVLAEIPDQVVGYMRSKNIVPLREKPESPPPYSERDRSGSYTGSWGFM